MTTLLVMLLVMAQAPALSLDQIRGDGNLEHRAKLAVDFAVQAERSAEDAYGKGDAKSVAAGLNSMLAGVEMARESLAQTGKSPRKHVGPFKSAELKTQDILRRLSDLERRMDSEERAPVMTARARVQEIHDAWFEGIMSGRK